jgi:hypothetical protein
MSDRATPSAPKSTAEKKWPPKGGQVQGGNAQKGRSGIAIGRTAMPRCSNMLQRPAGRKRQNTLCETFPCGNWQKIWFFRRLVGSGACPRQFVRRNK